MTARRVAVVDVGSNSLHLQVVEGSVTLAADRASVALGDFDAGGLRAAHMDDAIQALRAFRAQADALRCDAFQASGTAALRDATNAPKFLARVRRELGWSIRVLSGPDEARLAHAGARAGLGFEHALVFDLGGRSTEIAVGGDVLELAVSIRMGHLRALELGSRSAVEDEVARLLAPLDVPPSERLAGCAGTALTLGQMVHAARGTPSDGRHGLEVPRDELAELVDRMESQEVHSLPGLDPRRARTIALGGVAVLALLDGLGARGFTTCQTALREGLVQELASATS